VLIIGIALFKVRLVGLHFMDIRTAPRTLRLIFDGYVLAVFATLVTLDLVVS
jgi:Prokaryotic Cytochrome C oxidase subunit IV